MPIHLGMRKIACCLVVVLFGAGLLTATPAFAAYGAIVQLPYGLEGFAPARHLIKEDGKAIAADETSRFMVIEFDRNEKRIVLSHTRIWEQSRVEEKEAAKKEARVESDKTKKAIKTIQSKVEKATLGDLGALAEIKAKLKEEEKGEDTQQKSE